MQAQAEQEAKLRAETARNRRKSSFRAAPPPRFAQPPPPARSQRPATRALTPKLAVETRSAARANFDAMVAENKRREEVTYFLIIDFFEITALLLRHSLQVGQRCQEPMKRILEMP